MLAYYKKSKLPATYTEEFRDPEMWERLRSILEELKSEHCTNHKKIFRVWSAGCAGGDEVKSLHEVFSTWQDVNCLVSIYGTDIRVDKLFDARQKCKSLGSKPIKLRFKEHDLVFDEYLPYMNLILCRNTLMYFKTAYQDIILRKLHQSLRSGGYLVLGRGEHLKYDTKNLFKVIDSKNRIFQKIK